MSRNPPNRFYVYIHIRKSDGKIFYVGKGQTNRAWRFDGRNDHWYRTVDKHGLRVIIIKSGMSDKNSLKLECDLIQIYKHLGFPLTNKTLGGEGSSIQPETPTISSYEYGDFYGLTDAVEWLRANGYPKAAASGISRAINKKTLYIYNSEWSRVGDKSTLKKLKFTSNPNEAGGAKLVYCSNGMVFSSMKRAEIWLKDNVNSRASSGCISQVCNGSRSAYCDLGWSFHDLGKYQVGKHKNSQREVVCSNGMIFSSLIDAEKWLHTQGIFKAHKTNISKVCRGLRPIAYGYTWKYIDEGN